MGHGSVEAAIAAIRRGEMVVVVDDEDRENEGDLILAATAVTAEAMAFMIRHTSGLVCVALTEERADQLQLPLMVQDNRESQRTAFTVTVDYRHETTTGISAADRARTARALTDPDVGPTDFARPGHLHVLRARDGGVLKRSGHTEAAVDLARLAGLEPAGVLCEVVTADGLGMARRPELEELADRYGLIMISVAELIHYRREREQLVTRVASARVPTEWGEFRCIAYRSALDDESHVAFVYGEPAGRENVLVRVHSECLTGDVFGSWRCDCGSQLRMAMANVAAAGVGVVVYLRGHEGRGIGLDHKLRAYNLQDDGLDTLDANLALGLPIDSREYGIGAQILLDLGITTMRLMTNNPEKVTGVSGFGLTTVEQVALRPQITADNLRYLRTKRDRMGHSLGDLPSTLVVGGDA